MNKSPAGARQQRRRDPPMALAGRNSGSHETPRWREQDSNPRSLGPTQPYSMLLMHPEVGRPAIRVTAAASGQIRGNYTFILVSLSASMPLYEPRSQSQKLSTTAKLQSA